MVGIGSSVETPENLPEGVVYAGIDIRDAEAMAEFFTTYQVTTVYHFAGIKFVGKCEADPEMCFAINTKGTQAVLAAMEKAAVPHIVYASTYAVYDWSGDQVVLTETTPTNPATVYGKSKLQSEQAIIEAAASNSIKRYHILRYGNIVGAVPELVTHMPQSFFDKIVMATKTEETISLNGGDYNTVDGTVARDFIDVRDVATINHLVLSVEKSGLYNVSSGRSTTLKQLIVICEKISGKTISSVINPRSGNEPSSIIIDSDLITSEVGFTSTFTINDTVSSVLAKII